MKFGKQLSLQQYQVFKMLIQHNWFLAVAVMEAWYVVSDVISLERVCAKDQTVGYF